MSLLRSRIETMDTIAGGSSCDAFRSSSSCCRRSSTKVLPLSCDVEARTRYGPVAVTSLPRPALYGSAIARGFAFGDLYRSVQVENELRALERRARPVAAAAGRTHLAADMLHEDFITEGVQSAWPCRRGLVQPQGSSLLNPPCSDDSIGVRNVMGFS